MSPFNRSILLYNYHTLNELSRLTHVPSIAALARARAKEIAAELGLQELQNV